MTMIFQKTSDFHAWYWKARNRGKAKVKKLSGKSWIVLEKPNKEE